MKIRLPIIGQVLTGNDSKVQPAKAEPVEKSVGVGLLENFFKSDSEDDFTKDKRYIAAMKEWVYANVHAIADTSSSIEFQLFQVRVTDKIEFDEILDHEILNRLDKFNDYTTKSEGIYLTVAHEMLTGDSYWLMDSLPPDTEAFQILEPENVKVIPADDGIRIEAYKYTKTIRDAAGKTQRVEKTYPADKVIPFKLPNPKNPYRGLSKIEAASQTIDRDTWASEWNRRFFMNDATPGNIFSTDKRITPEDQRRIESDLKRKFGGVTKAHRTMILSGGLKPERLGDSQRDMEFLKEQEWTRDKIISLFGNTKVALGIVDDVNRANAEATKRFWIENTIVPEMKRIVDTLNEHFVSLYGENLVLGFKPPVPDDEQFKLDKYDKGYNRWLTRNEIRQMEGLEPVEGGDEFQSAPQVEPIVPEALRYVDYRKVLRKNRIYKRQIVYKETKDAATKVAKKIIAAKRKAKPKPKVKRSPKFSDDQVVKFWTKQIGIVEVHEELFNDRLEQIIGQIVENGVKRLDNEEARKTGDLVDKEYWIEEVRKFVEPILTDVMLLSGQLANDLIGEDTPYVPRNIEGRTKEIDARAALRAAILQFAGSMVDTDIDIMTNILADGLTGGQSIPVIRRSIQEHFTSFSKTQAERITRTEVIKASNLGSQDAFEQSDVVVAKQWLTAQDGRVDAECAPLDGEIIPLRENFFNIGDKTPAGTTVSYSNIKYPPLHPNCRCTLLPVFAGELGFDSRNLAETNKLKAKIEELKGQIDKRTKAYRDLEHKNLELSDYVKELEELAYE